ncbi:MAG TPA: hypothetical protein VF026_32070 [Ktedonobacteraceae bacterium]
MRTGQAAQVLAILNNTVLTLMDAYHVRNVAAQQRLFATRPYQALASSMMGFTEREFYAPPVSLILPWGTISTLSEVFLQNHASPSRLLTIRTSKKAWT